MKGLFHKLGKSSRKWEFQKADLTEIPSPLSNPARGWYQIHTFQAEEEPDFKELEWCLDRKDTLALVLFDIGSFRDRKLDEECMARLGKILSFFGQNNYDIILRVVYDHEGKAMEREPFFFTQVLEHLKQLGTVLSEYADIIFVYQGMLVGNWGEMHTSRFLSEDKLVRMADILRSCRGEEMYLAVRRPMYWRILHQKGSSQKMICRDGMGLYDDGMFGSESHLGTFGTLSGVQAGWREPWSRAEELNFEKELCRLVPNGGEAVYGGEFAGELTPAKVVNDLRQMQITYLNKVHDAGMLDIWRKWKYGGMGVWAEKSVFEYIGAHLGYRFLIQKVTVTPKKGGSPCLAEVEIEIENIGFASFYQEAEIYLEWQNDNIMQNDVTCNDITARNARVHNGAGRNSGEHCQTVLLDSNIRGWASGERRILACTMEAHNGMLFLTAKRKRDGRCIRFANLSDETGRAVLGQFCNYE